jgi:hypothetical protein
MANALTQFTITDVIPGYCRVTFSNPPINLEDPFSLAGKAGRARVPAQCAQLAGSQIAQASVSPAPAATFQILVRQEPHDQGDPDTQ